MLETNCASFVAPGVEEGDGRRSPSLFAAGIAALGLGCAAVPAAQGSTLLATIAGNDCAGVFKTVPEANGSGFANCVARFPLTGRPSQIAPTPVMIKFDFDGSGNITQTSINSVLFPSIDGSEFSFTFGLGGTGTGTWTYTPGPGDPAITAFVAKGGPGFNLFSSTGNSGAWTTPINPSNGRPFGLSHLTFYDTTVTPPEEMPEPASLALLGAGLFGLGFAARRRLSV